MVVGTVIDPELTNQVRVTVVATGLGRPAAAARPASARARDDARDSRAGCRDATVGSRRCAWCAEARCRPATTRRSTSRRCSVSAAVGDGLRPEADAGGSAGYSGVPAASGRLMARATARLRSNARLRLSAALGRSGHGWCAVRLWQRSRSLWRPYGPVLHAAAPCLSGVTAMSNQRMVGQRTLKNSIRATGVGLHTGKKVLMTLRPGRAGLRASCSGAPICRQPVDIRAHAENVGDTMLGTTLGKGEARVSTVEHLLSAFAGLGIDNAIVELQRAGSADHGRQRRSLRVPAAVGGHRGAARGRSASSA